MVNPDICCANSQTLIGLLGFLAESTLATIGRIHKRACQLTGQTVSLTDRCCEDPSPPMH